MKFPPAPPPELTTQPYPHTPVPHWPCLVLTHRWLAYLGVLLLDVGICLLVLVGLIRSSKGILVG